MGRRTFMKGAAAAGLTGAGTASAKSGEPLEKDEVTMTMHYQGYENYSLRLVYNDLGDNETDPGLDRWSIYGFDETDGNIHKEKETANELDTYFKGEARHGTGLETPLDEELVEDSEFIISEVTAENGDKLYGVFDKNDFLRMDPGEVHEAQGVWELRANSPEDAVNQYVQQV